MWAGSWHNCKARHTSFGRLQETISGALQSSILLFGTELSLLYTHHDTGAAPHLKKWVTVVPVQVAGLQRSLKYGARVQAESVKSLPACLQHIWRQEGLRGLYKGSLPSILKAAPSAAITFTAYEFILGALTAFVAAE